MSWCPDFDFRGTQDIVTAAEVRAARCVGPEVQGSLLHQLHLSFTCGLGLTWCASDRPVDVCDVELRERDGLTHTLQRVLTGSPSGTTVRQWENAEAVMIAHDGRLSSMANPAPADGTPVRATTPSQLSAQPKPSKLLVLRFLRPHDGKADGFQGVGFSKGLDEEAGRVELDVELIWPACSTEPVVCWLPVNPPPPLLQLAAVPLEPGRFEVELTGARHLPKIEKETPDPYCRVVCVASGGDDAMAADPNSGTGRSVAKTREVTNTFTPVWKEKFSIDMEEVSHNNALQHLAPARRLPV